MKWGGRNFRLVSPPPSSFSKDKSVLISRENCFSSFSFLLRFYLIGNSCFSSSSHSPLSPWKKGLPKKEKSIDTWHFIYSLMRFIVVWQYGFATETAQKTILLVSQTFWTVWCWNTCGTIQNSPVYFASTATAYSYCTASCAVKKSWLLPRKFRQDSLAMRNKEKPSASDCIFLQTLVYFPTSLLLQS